MTKLFSALGILTVFLGAAGYFAGIQALWVDETTQLSGIALDPAEQLAWLLHRADPGLGVPPDRMPPLSYWLGSLWGAVFGVTEISLRWFGIVCVLAAAPALYFAGHRAGGTLGGLFMLAFVLWSPNILSQAVEIRAYPVFLMFASWGTWVFAKLVLNGPEMGSEAHWDRLALLGAIVLLASYTHFFGIVFGASLFAAVLLDRLLRGGAVLPVLAVGTATVVLCIGVLPFAMAAVGISSNGGTEAAGLAETLWSTVRLGLRIVAHGSHFIYMALAAVFGLGIAGLLALFLAGGRTSLPWNTRIVLLAPLLIAFLALAALDLVITGFNALAAHYNIWMVPVATLLLTTVLGTDEFSWRGRIAALSAALTAAGQGAAAALFIVHAEYFTHGPGEWVADAIADPARTLVVHDMGGPWGHVYFPIRYLKGPDVTHIVITPDGAPQLVTPAGFEPINTDDRAFAAGFDTILYVSARNRDTRFLSERIREGTFCGGGEMPTIPGLDTPDAPETYCAFVAATMARASAKHR